MTSQQAMLAQLEKLLTEGLYEEAERRFPQFKTEILLRMVTTVGKALGNAPL